MRIVFFGNNKVGLSVARFLANSADDVVGVVIHPQKRQKYAQEIVETLGVEKRQVFDGSKLRNQDVVDQIAALKPDFGVSAFFGYILKPELLSVFARAVVNLHPAFLPFNRGAYPNVWSIIEGTPAGATLHLIDPGIDTGRIIGQKEIAVESWDTGGSLYAKLEICCLDVFRQFWPLFRMGQIDPSEQVGAGTYHKTSDVATIDQIELDKKYSAGDLIDIIRARSFPPHSGAFFLKDGVKVNLKLELEPVALTESKDE